MHHFVHRDDPDLDERALAPKASGPSFIKIGMAVLYPLDELERWDRSNLVSCQRTSFLPLDDMKEKRPVRELADIAKPLGIAIHDHIIVGRDGHSRDRDMKYITGA